MFSSLYKFLTGVAACLTLFSCDSSSGTIEMMPFKQAKSDAWVLVSPEGTIDGKATSSSPTMSINGFYAITGEGGQISLHSTSGKDLSPSFAGLARAGVMSAGRIPVVYPNRRICLLDENGDSVTTLMPVKDREIDAVAPFFSSDRMIFHLADGSANGLFGAIDREGKVKVEPIYDRLYPFHGDYALAEQDSVYEVKEQKKTRTKTRTVYSLIDRNGKTAVKFPEGMTPISEGVYREVMAVNNNGTPGFINTKGKFIAVPKNVKKILQSTDHIYAYSDHSGNKGIMTIEGKELFPAKFTDIAIVDNDHFIVKDKKMDHPSLVDRDEEVIFTFADSKKVISLAEVFPFKSELKFIGQTSRNTYILYDCRGNRIRNEEFSDFSTRMIINPKTTRSGDMVASDYFDLSEAVKKLTGPLTPAGYGIAKIGFTMKNLTSKSPEKLTSQKSLRLLSAKGDRYELNVTAYTDAPITTSTPIYKEKSDGLLSFLEPDEVIGHNYDYNPKATVKKIVATLSTESISFDEIYPMVLKDIRNNKYKELESTPNYSVFQRQNGKHYIVVIPRPMQKGIELHILNSNYYSSSISKLKREADINFALI